MNYTDFKVLKIKRKYVDTYPVVLEGLFNPYADVNYANYRHPYYNYLEKNKNYIIECYDENNNIIFDKVCFKIGVYFTDFKHQFPDFNKTLVYVDSKNIQDIKFIRVYNYEKSQTDKLLECFEKHKTFDEEQKLNSSTDTKDNPLNIGDIVLYIPGNCFAYISEFRKSRIKIFTEENKSTIVNSKNLLRIPNSEEEIEKLKTNITLNMLKN
jgi:hypothetical protein